MQQKPAQPACSACLRPALGAVGAGWGERAGGEGPVPALRDVPVCSDVPAFHAKKNSDSDGRCTSEHWLRCSFLLSCGWYGEADPVACFQGEWGLQCSHVSPPSPLASWRTQARDPRSGHLLLPFLTGWLEMTMCKPHREAEESHIYDFLNVLSLPFLIFGNNNCWIFKKISLRWQLFYYV